MLEVKPILSSGERREVVFNSDALNCSSCFSKHFLWYPLRTHFSVSGGWSFICLSSTSTESMASMRRHSSQLHTFLHTSQQLSLGILILSSSCFASASPSKQNSAKVKADDTLICLRHRTSFSEDHRFQIGTLLFSC